jgi:hypothetical protein
MLQKGATAAPIIEEGPARSSDHGLVNPIKQEFRLFVSRGGPVRVMTDIRSAGVERHQGSMIWARIYKAQAASSAPNQSNLSPKGTETLDSNPMSRL